MRGFQPGAFQSNAFQMDAAASTTQRFVPGDYYAPKQRHRTEEERTQRRIELGIIPAPVEKVVEKAAKRVVARAQTEARKQDRQDYDPLVWLREHHAQQAAILERELRDRKIAASLDDQRTYMILLGIEIERFMEQEREDEQIVMLLMDM